MPTIVTPTGAELDLEKLINVGPLESILRDQLIAALKKVDELERQLTLAHQQAGAHAAANIALRRALDSCAEDVLRWRSWLSTQPDVRAE